jgi:hypothetical protein
MTTHAQYLAPVHPAILLPDRLMAVARELTVLEAKLPITTPAERGRARVRMVELRGVLNADHHAREETQRVRGRTLTDDLTPCGCGRGRPATGDELSTLVDAVQAKVLALQARLTTSPTPVRSEPEFLPPVPYWAGR